MIIFISGERIKKTKKERRSGYLSEGSAKIWHYASTLHATDLVQEVYWGRGLVKELKAMSEWGYQRGQQTEREHGRNNWKKRGRRGTRSKRVNRVWWALSGAHMPPG